MNEGIYEYQANPDPNPNQDLRVNEGTYEYQNAGKAEIAKQAAEGLSWRRLWRLRAGLQVG